MRIQLPSRVYKKDRDKFQKGMFVAANVKIAEDGTALFGQVDSEKVQGMQEGRLCQLCGRKIALTDWCVFPGDHGRFKYQEAPLHIECARYSAQVCPHMLRKSASFGFAVCKKYHYVAFEPPYFLDEGCVPDWSGLSDWERFALSMAHKIVERSETVEKPYCSTCPSDFNNSMGHMTYDEFMKWSA